MSDNRALWKALHSLTHPLSVLAILLLLFNDHWLRYAHPSWLTGKLGDFTWLVFAPFIAGMVFALIVPKSWEKQSHYVGWLAIGFIGVWFASAKTLPIINEWTLDALELLMGYRGQLLVDPTDLITLPALLISWHIWQRASETSLHLKPVVYMLFGLGILGTMATSYAPEPTSSIETICELEDGRLVTTIEYNDGYYWDLYSSHDAGLTWQVETYNTSPDMSDLQVIQCSILEQNFTTPIDNYDTIYRWQYDDYIEYSDNGGEDWIRVHELDELEQTARINPPLLEIDSSPYEDPIRQPSPVSGLVHSQSGNLILAMSTYGTLVITPEGYSEWVSIADFSLPELPYFSIYDLVTPNPILLVTLWFLVLVSTVVLIHSEWVSTRIILTAGWIIWIFLVSSSTNLDIFLWGLFALFALVFIAIPMSLWSLFILTRYYYRTWGLVILVAILASVAYLLPLLMWTHGRIAKYSTASVFMLMLVGCVLVTCYSYFRDKLPARHVPEKSKRKRKPKNDDSAVSELPNE